MSIDPSRTPVVAAIGQSIERDEIVCPEDMAARAARAALDTAPKLASRIQRATMVSVIFSTAGRRPASVVAERLGLPGGAREITTAGGNTPQWLVTRAAVEISRGDLDATLIVGAEASRSQRAAGGAGTRLAMNNDEGDADEVVGAREHGMIGAAELAAGLMLPAVIYPIFESAIAAEAGRSFDEQRRFLGPLMAAFTEVAAGHPSAWFPHKATSEELATVTSGNRLVSEPYTKRMNAFPNVDQGAALVVCSLSAARDAGVEDEVVYVWSGADTADVLLPTARPTLGHSPAIAAAARRAFEAAGVGADDIGAFDLYSCFPCAVEMGAEAIGVALDDRRGLTVTGGLPYFGGPGNNYTTHGIATMVERLRERGGLGLCTGLGGFATKHGVGIYGAEPPPGGFRRGDTSADQADIDASAIEVATAADGVATVDGATVCYDNDGSVQAAPVIARLEDGRRVAAKADEAALDEMAGRSLVGHKVRIAGTPPVWRLES